MYGQREYEDTEIAAVSRGIADSDERCRRGL